MNIKWLLHRLAQVPYLISGLTRRFTTLQRCPACGGQAGAQMARKLFHTLHECADCGLLHRHPIESSAEMQDFYDDDYVEPGMTTELPDDDALAELMRTGFKGSGKDFSSHIELLRALGLRDGGRLLDFGANWGYASWQFLRAGFAVQSFEISRPRARFGEKLGLKIVTSRDEVEPPFDAIFSCHVLEHVPNPRETLEWMLTKVRPGGLVLGITPNGSQSFRTADPRHFQEIWGQVHPVLLTDVFVQRIAGRRPFLIMSDSQAEAARSWDLSSQECRDCSGDGLFFAIRKTAA